MASRLKWSFTLRWFYWSDSSSLRFYIPRFGTADASFLMQIRTLSRGNSIIKLSNCQNWKYASQKTLQVSSLTGCRPAKPAFLHTFFSFKSAFINLSFGLFSSASWSHKKSVWRQDERQLIFRKRGGKDQVTSRYWNQLTVWQTDELWTDFVTSYKICPPFSRILSVPCPHFCCLLPPHERHSSKNHFG